MTTLRELIDAGAPTVGTFLNLGSPLAAEVCALSGFDWLLVDLEHGAGGEEGLVTQLLAGQAHDVPVLVRVESDERSRVGHALDLGAAGVMLPRLDTVAQVERALAHGWYPPAGDRGVAGYNRARLFGADVRDAATVDRDVVSVVQIESLAALDGVEQIAAIHGVDVLFVGPRDLSYSLGVADDFAAPVFVDALARVAAAARTHHVQAGILTSDVDGVAALHDEGFHFVAVASDSALLRAGARAAAARAQRRAKP